MSVATITRIAPSQVDPQRELQQELSHVRDLVVVRDVLRRYGAAAAELRECDAVVAEARARLAECARRASGAYAPAA